jgi:hypothetical protein
VVEDNQHDKAKAGRFLDFPVQNKVRKAGENKLQSEKTTIPDRQQVDGRQLFWENQTARL